MPLRNCEINFVLPWSENFKITSRALREKTVGTDTNKNPKCPKIINPKNATFKTILPYRLKVKTIEHLFQSPMYQMFK